MSDKLVDFNKTQNKALKLRIFPTDSQIQIIESTFGACRFIYSVLRKSPTSLVWGM